MIDFLYPLMFLLLLAPLLVAFAPWEYVSRRSALRISFMDDVQYAEGNREQSKGVSRATILQKVMLLFVWSLVIFALAKPQFIGEPIVKEIDQTHLLKHKPLLMTLTMVLLMQSSIVSMLVMMMERTVWLPDFKTLT